MMWLWVMSASAGVFRHPEAALFDATSPVDDVVASADGSFVGYPAGDGNFWVLDTRSWRQAAITSCGDATGAATTTSGGQTVFLTGCTDGLGIITIDSTGSSYTFETITINDLGSIYAVETDGTYAYVVGTAASTSAGAGVVSVALADGSLGWSSTLNSANIEDTALVGSTLFVLYGGAVAAQVSTSSGSVSDITTTNTLYSFLDMWPIGSAGVLAADDQQGVIGFLEVGNVSSPSPLAFVDTPLQAITASTSEGLVVASTESDLLFFDVGAGSGTPQIEDVPDYSLPYGKFRELTFTDGYLFGGGTDGGLYVFTDRPWVEVVASGDTVVAGDTASVSFSSDTDGTYEIVVGGGFSGDGSPVEGGSGTVEAGDTISVDLTIDERFAEGANLVWVFVTDGGAVGHGAGVVTVDNPPGAVNLGANALSGGDSYLTLAFDGLSDADISHYILYVSDTAFTPDSFPEDGPADFDKNDELELPMEIPTTPGADVGQEIYPLENGKTYFVAVRAVDTGGQIGPLSNVRSGAPIESFSAAERAGETGGGPCGNSGSAAMLGLLGAVSLRRRLSGVSGRAGSAVAAVVAGLLLLPGVAEAKDGKAPRTTSNVQLRYGPSYLVDEHILEGFAGNHQMLTAEYGFASQFVDINAGIGFWQEMGWLIDANGATTDEHDMFTIWPMTLTGTLRLDFFNEQPIVPIGRIGADYWAWKENWAVPTGSSETSKLSGGKVGWHYGFGGMLLLDALDRRAASELEASTGIDDTYLVGEWRKTSMKSESGFDLSSTEITFGLKCDF